MVRKIENFKHILSLLVLLSVSVASAKAQEINAAVSIDYSQIQGTNVSVFKTLEAALNEFLNNRTWTDQEYLQNERVDCNFNLTISKAESDIYSASLAVSARRPIYNASINTTLINLIDNDIKFQYKEFDPLVFNRNSLSQDLTAIFGFYVYMILGIDGDTFKEFGGDAHFDEARSISNNAQSSTALKSGGWDRLGLKQNRTLYVSQITSSEFRPYRSYVYRYHRLGLDVMADDVKKGEKVILDGLPDLKKINDNSPSSYTMQLFFDVKNVEIQNIIKEMDAEDATVAQQKKELITMLKRLDPSRLQVYEKLN